MSAAGLATGDSNGARHRSSRGGEEKPQEICSTWWSVHMMRTWLARAAVMTSAKILLDLLDGVVDFRGVCSNELTAIDEELDGS